MSESLHNASKVRRRNRVINSCLECRRRKLKCTRTHPCVSCTKNSRKCVFLEPSALDPVGLTKLTEIKEKVGDLEHLLEDEVALRAKLQQRSHSPVDKKIKAEDESDVVPQLPIHEAAYENDADGELDDLGLRLGKMKITERIGGLVRPHLVQELDSLVSAKDGHLPYPVLPPRSSLNSTSNPAIPFTLPTSSLGLGTLASPDFNVGAFLPSKGEADFLYLQYYAAVDPLAHILHKPSFDQQYSKFWLDIYQGIIPSKANTALIFAVFLAAATSLPSEAAQQQFEVPKQSLIAKFHHAAEQSLVRANFMKATSIETLQAIVIFLIPQCREDISRGHSALVGALIRLAQSMGLNHDNDGYGFTPLECHIRRLLWYQICLLDLMTAEVQGPQPTIRDDDYDTKLPLNVDDTNFTSSNREPEPSTCWTTVTFSLMRWEINEIKRHIFQERRKIDKKTTSFSISAALIDEKRRALVDKYLPTLNDEIPLQRHAKLVLRLSLGKMDAMMMQRHLSVAVDGEERQQMREDVTKACLAVCENGRLLDTDSVIEIWRWYTGAYHQYHSALFLLTIAYQQPTHSYIDRIWACLDYVFDWDFGVPLEREERARNIILLLSERLKGFLKSRKVRVPLPSHKMSGRKVSKSLDKLVASHASSSQHNRWEERENSSASPGSNEIGSETLRMHTAALPPGDDVNMGNWYLSDYQLSAENSLNIDWDEWDTLMRIPPP